MPSPDGRKSYASVIETLLEVGRPPNRWRYDTRHLAKHRKRWAAQQLPICAMCKLRRDLLTVTRLCEPRAAPLKFETKESFLRFDPIGRKGGL